MWPKTFDLVPLMDNLHFKALKNIVVCTICMLCDFLNCLFLGCFSLDTSDIDWMEG